MQALNLVQQLAVFVLPLIFAITLHEVAHGWVADRLGDHTARLHGRLTLNPLPHIDPVGTVLVPLALFALSSLSGGGGFLFGWAKPVPIDPRNFRNPRRDMALTAVAGPASNLLMLLGWALALRLAMGLQPVSPWVAAPLAYTAYAGILVNGILMALNLLPILPLDGGRVLASLLPARLAIPYARTEPWGLFILVALIATDLLGVLLTPLLSWSQSLGFHVAGML